MVIIERRTVGILGHHYKPGEVLPASVIAELAKTDTRYVPGLIRNGLAKEVPDAPRA